MIPRCPHGVYSPDGDGLPSAYCSGCTSPSDPLPPADPADDEHTDADDLPYGTDDCPECEGKLTVNGYDIKCETCGFEV